MFIREWKKKCHRPYHNGHYNKILPTTHLLPLSLSIQKETTLVLCISSPFYIICTSSFLFRERSQIPMILFFLLLNEWSSRLLLLPISLFIYFIPPPLLTLFHTNYCFSYFSGKKKKGFDRCLLTIMPQSLLRYWYIFFEELMAKFI